LAAAAQLSHKVAGPLPLRLRPGGFAGLARIIVEQQLSVASAAAIWARVEDRLAPLTPEGLLAQSTEDLQALGLSRPKIRYLHALAQAMIEDRLSPARLARMESEAAIAHLTAVPGLGRWSAEIYLLFCLGRSDVFPAGDLALQSAHQGLYGLTERADAKALAIEAQAWAPWRGVAARLLWRTYRLQKDGHNI